MRSGDAGNYFDSTQDRAAVFAVRPASKAKA